MSEQKIRGINLTFDERLVNAPTQDEEVYCCDCETFHRRDGWDIWFRDNGERRLMVHDYPECGPGAIGIEKLYQMFKQRLLEESQQNTTENNP